MPISGREIKYGPLLNNFDRNYTEEIGEVCEKLLTCFFKIEDVKIIRVKAIRKKMRLKGGDLRVALFRKTIEIHTVYRFHCFHMLQILLLSENRGI